MRPCRATTAQSIITWVIYLVAIYDIYCTMKYSESLLSLEQNPFAYNLIDSKTVTSFHLTGSGAIAKNIVNHVDVTNLVTFKVFGLLITCKFLDWIHKRNIKMSLTICSVLLFVQVCLFIYLIK
jgi:hypothetical protein